jgi:alkaline phosphatase D
MNPSRLRRQLVLGLPLAAALSPAFLRHARAADVPRFGMGIASGHPRPDTVVLWTRLGGDDLPDKVDVQWEIARDEAFKDIAARGTEVAEAAWAHSVHAEPAGLAPNRPYWYRFSALGQQSPVGRTRTAPAPDAKVESLRFAIASCQRFDHSHFGAWRHAATQDLDLVVFLGDYIYEYASPPNALRRHEGSFTRSLDQYRARYAQYKGDPALQAAHAAAPWIVIWDDHEVENDYAAGTAQVFDPLFRFRREAATQAYWEHMPFPKAMRPRGTELRLFGRFDWGTLARIHTLDDRQYRDVQACPKFGRNGSNTVPLKDCAAFVDPKRSLHGADQERWLAEGWDAQRGWNLLAQQTLMARCSETDTANGGATYWSDGWDGYAASRNRLLAGAVARKANNLVALGGDVHAHYVADLKADFDDDKSPVMAAEFCGTSIASHGRAQKRIDEARAFNPHIHHARADQRGYTAFTLGPKRLDATLFGVRDAHDPESVVDVQAKFSVEAGRPGVQPA